MGRLLKCYGSCNQKYPKEELVKIGGKNYCKKCAEIIQKEKEERNSLYNYIKYKYNVAYPTGFMLKQIKEIRENGITYKEMELTLKYCFDTLDKVADINYGVGGLINYYHEHWKRYVNDINNGSTDLGVTFETETIVINNRKPPQRRIRNRILDME